MAAADKALEEDMVGMVDKSQPPLLLQTRPPIPFPLLPPSPSPPHKEDRAGGIRAHTQVGMEGKADTEGRAGRADKAGKADTRVRILLIQVLER